MSNMLDKKYRVTKEIKKEDSWECGANVGDILTVAYWGGASCSGWTLMKGDKAVCDEDSQCALDCCERI